jgi:hypothetical protein
MAAVVKADAASELVLARIDQPHQLLEMLMPMVERILTSMNTDDDTVNPGQELRPSWRNALYSRHLFHMNTMFD